jgi:putative polyhydroxyalkanoate system protein
MSVIEIKKAFTMPRRELKGELDELARKLEQQFQLNCEWHSDDCLEFRRSGAQGRIDIGEDEIELRITLGILMELFRGTIEQGIAEFVDEHIY